MNFELLELVIGNFKRIVVEYKKWGKKKCIKA